MSQGEIKRALRSSVALSVRQPWCWAILHGGKDVENRDWKPWNGSLKFRGDVLLHASLRFEQEAVDTIRQIFVALGRSPAEVPDPRPWMHPNDPNNPYLTGGIVGQMEITGAVSEHPSPWFFGRPYGLTLANAKPLPFRPLKGRLGFFKVPHE